MRTILERNPSHSEAQRRLFGAALSYKRGNRKGYVTPQAKALSKLPEKTLREFASAPKAKKRGASKNGIMMTIGAANPRSRKPHKNGSKYREYTVPLAEVGGRDAEKAIERYAQFHEAPPTRWRVFEYDDGKPGVEEHHLFKVGTAEIKIDTVEGTDGRDIRIKPLRIGTVYNVGGNERSNKSGKNWIHSHRESGGKPPIHAVDPKTGIMQQLGGTYEVEDWIRR